MPKYSSAYLEFLGLFAGKVNAAFAGKTYDAWNDLILTGYTEQELIDARKSNVMHHRLGDAAYAPYRYPYHWLNNLGCVRAWVLQAKLDAEARKTEPQGLAAIQYAKSPFVNDGWAYRKGKDGCWVATDGSGRQLRLKAIKESSYAQHSDIIAARKAMESHSAAYDAKHEIDKEWWLRAFAAVAEIMCECDDIGRAMDEIEGLSLTPFFPIRRDMRNCIGRIVSFAEREGLDEAFISVGKDSLSLMYAGENIARIKKGAPVGESMARKPRPAQAPAPSSVRIDGLLVSRREDGSWFASRMHDLDLAPTPLLPTWGPESLPTVDDLTRAVDAAYARGAIAWGIERVGQSAVGYQSELPIAETQPQQTAHPAQER